MAHALVCGAPSVLCGRALAEDAFNILAHPCPGALTALGNRLECVKPTSVAPGPRAPLVGSRDRCWHWLSSYWDPDGDDAHLDPADDGRVAYNSGLAPVLGAPLSWGAEVMPDLQYTL